MTPACDSSALERSFAVDVFDIPKERGPTRPEVLSLRAEDSYSKWHF